MITPSYGLTATERILPSLALDFTTATLDPRVTVTRAAASATRINASGVIETVAADTPRFNFNPVNLTCLGLLIERARTNLLLNSLIDGTSLATQSVTVTAVAHTLSFYGTGSIVLSGAASATVTGTSAYPTRTTLVFTPTAGSLTLTVSGTVQFAQLEVGGFVSSFIPTAASQVTRNSDVVEMTGANFSSWYQTNAGSFCAEYTLNSLDTSFQTTGILGSGSSARAIYLTGAATRIFNGTSFAASSSVAVGLELKTASAYSSSGVAISTNGAVASSAGSSAGGFQSATTLGIGGNTGSQTSIFGTFRKIAYYPLRITNAELQAFSK
jgi:hypothetical protein